MSINFGAILEGQTIKIKHNLKTFLYFFGVFYLSKTRDSFKEIKKRDFIEYEKKGYMNLITFFALLISEGEISIPSNKSNFPILYENNIKEHIFWDIIIKTVLVVLF